MDDASLARLAADAGLTVSPAGLRDLVARVAASGERPESTGWIELLLENPSSDTVQRLQEARRVVRSAAEPWSPARVNALWGVLKRESLAGFVLPLADEHLGEFMPGAARRLAW